MIVTYEKYRPIEVLPQALCNIVGFGAALCVEVTYHMSK